MLRLNPSQPPPAFSLDKRDLARKRGMKKREWRLLIMLPFALVVMGVFINYLIGYARMIPNGPLEPVIEELVLKPMATPRLSDAAPLPDTAAIAAELPTVRELIADRANIRHEDALDALTLAWAGELTSSDRTVPPIPQRVLARDLLLGGVMPGAAVMIHGRLLDSVAAPIAGGEAYQRLAVQLDEQQIAQVLAPASASELVIGREVQVLGRFLGSAPAPTGTSGETQMPLIVAREARPAEHAANDVDADLEEMRGTVPAHLPDDLYANIGDERSVLETRPYYFLLGQARIDRENGPEVFATVPAGNDVADDIHQRPADFRGKPFNLTGYVYRAWEDPNVARDQPFGVARCLRVLMWHRDFGKVTELLDGKPTVKSQILRLYEVCLIGDQPAPARGALITVSGRFFKFRAIPVNPDSLRDRRNDVHRQSDYVYTFAFVGTGYAAVPSEIRYQFRWVDTVVTAAAIGLTILLIVLLRRDRRLESRIGDQVKRLRSTRKALQRARVDAVHAQAPAPASGADISGPTLPAP